MSDLIIFLSGMLLALLVRFLIQCAVDRFSPETYPVVTTKQIEFQGITYTVPDWVHYVAMDQVANVWGFENYPEKSSWQLVSDTNKIVFIAELKMGSSTHWKETLTAV